ncbi:MAG TPA: helix-turn-helix domain-containing protein [Nocardioides sp.]|nr:helix-turn-helix domain-containing protein [Nocardioides sp.]
MLLSDLLATPHLDLRLRYEAPGGLERTVGRVATTALLEPGDYLAGSELVLTELAWRRTPEDSATFVRSIAERGVTTLITGTALFGPAPDDLVEACRAHAVTLIEVPAGTTFVDVTEHLAGVEAAESGDRLSAGLVRQRELLASLATGRTLPEIVGRVAREIGHACRVLTPTGRPVVGGDPELDDATVDEVVHRYLTTNLLPATVAAGGATYSVFAVGSALGQRLTGWLLVVDGDHHEWPREHADAIADLSAIVALDRTRRDERVRAVRPIASDVLALVESGGPSPEVASRLRQAGLDPEAPVVVLAAHLGGLADEAATTLVEDVAQTIGPPFVTVDPTGPVVALLPADPDPVARVRAGFGRLAAGIGREDRVAVGLSSATPLTALSGALDEARFAARSARAGGGRVSVLASEQVTSHVALLAAVPDDVRRAYALRLLGTLVDHDERSGGDLVETLRTFLACSGSWTRTAEELHLHVNTVRYRIERVQELTGRDLARFDDRVDIHLALLSL